MCDRMYEKGKGTAADKAMAKRWFQKPAAQTEDEKIQEKAKKILWEKF